MIVRAEGHRAIEPISAANACASELRMCARLFRSALPEFYTLFESDEDSILMMIANQIGKAGTELQQCYVCRHAGRILAALGTVPMGGLPAAQTVGLAALDRKSV